MLSNLAETLHSSAKWKNRQVAKIWGLYLKKQRFGDTMQFPEGLENTPFYLWAQLLIWFSVVYCKIIAVSVALGLNLILFFLF